MMADQVMNEVKATLDNEIQTCSYLSSSGTQCMLFGVLFGRNIGEP